MEEFKGDEGEENLKKSTLTDYLPNIFGRRKNKEAEEQSKAKEESKTKKDEATKPDINSSKAVVAKQE